MVIFDPKIEKCDFREICVFWGPEFWTTFLTFFDNFDNFVSREFVSSFGMPKNEEGESILTKKGSNFRYNFDPKPDKKVPFWVDIHKSFSRTLY